MEPRIAYHHPILDARFGIKPDDNPRSSSTDDELRRLMDDFVTRQSWPPPPDSISSTSSVCQRLPGPRTTQRIHPAGGVRRFFENRTRFTREFDRPRSGRGAGLSIGVRVSAFDFVPFEDDPATRSGSRKGGRRPVAIRAPLALPLRFWNQCGQSARMRPERAIRFLEMLAGFRMWTFVNITCGSPYYNPHIQRPAYFHRRTAISRRRPLAGVARQIDVVRQLKERFPAMIMVGSGYSYLQDFLPQVGQAVVRSGWSRFHRNSRMCSAIRKCLSIRSGPDKSTRSDLPHLQRLHDRAAKGLISGCFPLDEAYRRSDAGKKLKELKKAEEAG